MRFAGFGALPRRDELSARFNDWVERTLDRITPRIIET
jgi:hypothetical protein